MARPARSSGAGAGAGAGQIQSWPWNVGSAISGGVRGDGGGGGQAPLAGGPVTGEGSGPVR